MAFHERIITRHRGNDRTPIRIHLTNAYDVRSLITKIKNIPREDIRKVGHSISDPTERQQHVKPEVYYPPRGTGVIVDFQKHRAPDPAESEPLHSA